MDNKVHSEDFMIGTDSESSVLPGCVPPQPNENLPAYILRLSELNGYHRPGVVMRIAGYRGTTAAFFRHDLQSLATTTGQKVSALEKLLYKRVRVPRKGYVTKVSGHVVPRFLINTDDPKICPHCIEEDGYIPWWWDFLPIVACPKHGSLMVQHCPACGDKVRWQRRGLNRCHCGHSWSGMEAEQASSAARRISSISHATLTGMYCENDEIDARFLSMTTGEFGWFVSLVGQWRLGSHESAVTHIRKLNHADHVNIVEAAYPVLVDWPNAFHRFLDQVASVRGVDDSQADILRQLGHVYRVLMYFFDSASSSFIQDEVKRWGELWVRSKERALSRKEVASLALEGVANQLGIGIDATRKMAAKGAIEVRKRENQRFRFDVFVPSEETKQAVEKMKSDMIGSIHARRILGLGQSTMERLRDEEFFSTDKDALLDGRRNHSFSRQECEQLLADFRRLAEPVADDGVKRIKLIEACRVYSSDRIPTSMILRAVRDREMRLLTDEGSQDLRCFWLAKQDVHRLAVKIACDGDTDLIDLYEAIEGFGVSHGVLIDLAERKVIRSEVRRIGSREHRLISRSELESWLANNVMSKDVARKMKMRLGGEKAFLAERGILPSLDSQTKRETRWYARRDVGGLISVT